MGNFVKLFSKAQLIGSINPKAWDALIPKQKFTFSDAHVDLLVADLVREVSAEMSDKELSVKVFDLSHEMARSASSALANSWEPGDELCPPWRFPFPPRPWWFEDFSQLFGPRPQPWQSDDVSHVTGPRPEPWRSDEISQVLGPQPEPWKTIRSVELVQAAYVLTQAAALTSSVEFNRALIGLATNVANTATRTLVEDIERCGNVPRPHFPKKPVPTPVQ